ncbi:hypothetical protein L3V77_24305 [Vibrio sp. DW001]|uniref:hypothetical protein n=1 Tax=Vibrio sp. DW001 TaxID=2912315 RepID=UPI0023AEC9E3|nr:hypothetical protein [Vibrio sp. DW001]WED29057.1 hypothetical protein L3V77_24305 [Vibrio sp. DW001]
MYKPKTENVIDMGNINRTKYHELNQLLWDMHVKYIAPKTAFELYEKRWAYVDTTKLGKKEKQLIEMLTKEYGNGVFMPASH